MDREQTSDRANGKKLLLFDLDGTLLTTEKVVSLRTREAIAECRGLGHLIGYVTARSIRRVASFIENLPCDGIAYYNGAAIYTGGTLIEKNEIPFAEGLEFIQNLQRAYPKALIGVYLEPWNYYNGELRHIVTKESLSCTMRELPPHDIQRIRIVLPEGDYSKVEGMLSRSMAWCLTADNSAIVMHEHANKANASRRIAQGLGVSLSDVIAFGDDVNDIPMIELAGTGVAMGNAVDALKSVADAVTDTNDNDGIAKWMSANLLQHA